MTEPITEVTANQLFPERTPIEVWKELRVKLERMNSGEKFTHLKNAEECAFAIQRLQQEFKRAKEFHIGLAPDPGKLIMPK